MITFDGLLKGEQYERQYLSKIWGFKGYHAICRGIVTPKESKYIILFITKEKQKGNHQYKDYMIDDLLYMEGETNHLNDRRLINSIVNDVIVQLFYREKHHRPFIFCGEANLMNYEIRQSEPSRFIFRLK